MPMSIAGLPSGVGGPGRTQYFNFQYDNSLSDARGRALAADLMNYCDDDIAQLSAWFSGRALDMSPPITVSLENVVTDAAGNPDPRERLGASWYGALAWPLQVTIKFGEFPLTSGTPTMLARYLLAAEVSEMYMRAINATGFTNPWFRALNEGNKGEALSRFLALQLLLRAYPGVTAIPWLIVPAGFRPFIVTQKWLDGPRDYDWLEVNNDDHLPGENVGCGTLFLCYLHDQLGYRIEDIINAGGGHLSNVYVNLTGGSGQDAWDRFVALVDSHYPHAHAATAVGAATPAGAPGFVPSYFPPLESVFPVSDLTAFSATPQVSWAPSTIPSVVHVSVDRPPKMPPVAINLTSSHPAIIPPFSVLIFPPSTTAIAAFTVLPQAADFESELVTLTASYGGKDRTADVSVVSPDPKGLPALDIEVERADPCELFFIEGTPQTFKITNIFVFADQHGISYSWSVTGAMPGATDTPSLTIPALPAAGQGVTVDVIVTNAQGLKAEGTLSFKTIALDLKVLDSELRCRLSRFRNFTVSIPEWTSVENVDVREEQLKVLQEELVSVSEAVESVQTVIQRMNGARERVRA